MKTNKSGLVLILVVATGAVLAAVSYLSGEGERTQAALDGYEACMLGMTQDEYKAATTGPGVTEQDIIELAVAIERTKVENKHLAEDCSNRFGL